MTRFIQHGLTSKPPKESKPKPTPKPGTYTSKELEGTKKILTNTGKF